MEYDQIKNNFCNGNMIKSLKDGIVRKYSGFLTVTGVGDNEKGFDSFNEDLVVYQNGILAEVVAVGIDENEEHRKHIEKVLKVCDSIGCTVSQLLYEKDYMKELS